MLRVDGLSVQFQTTHGQVYAVQDVSFQLESGDTLGIVGESGSGKSVTSMAIMGLLPKNAAVSGTIQYDDKDLTQIKHSELLDIRGNRIAMIFQEPMTSLNPIHSCGRQIMEGILVHKAMDKAHAKEKALELLQMVGIPEPLQRFKEYPHQMSGGMRQRVMIAMALACNPDILIADEPTTALDVTIQAQILALMQQLQKDLNMSIIMITHDLGIVAEMCEKVLVMYTGQVVEKADIKDIFEKPLHPYTEGLLKARPRISGQNERLVPIEGMVPNLFEMPVGCSYHPRCPYVFERCIVEKPPLISLADGRCVRCFRYATSVTAATAD